MSLSFPRLLVLLSVLPFLHNANGANYHYLQGIYAKASVGGALFQRIKAESETRSFTLDAKPKYNFDLSAGYRYDNFRAEIMGIAARVALTDIIETTKGSTSQHKNDANVLSNIVAIGLNGYYEQIVSSSTSLLLGLGGGFSRAHIAHQISTTADKFEQASYAMFYNVIIMPTIHLSSQISITAQYKFLNTNKLKFLKDPDSKDDFISGSLKMHALNLGVIFKFS